MPAFKTWLAKEGFALLECISERLVKPLLYPTVIMGFNSLKSNIDHGPIDNSIESISKTRTPYKQVLLGRALYTPAQHFTYAAQIKVVVAFDKKRATLILLQHQRFATQHSDQCTKWLYIYYD